MLTDDVSQSDWEKLQFYGSHIRWLCMHCLPWRANDFHRRRSIAPSTWTTISHLTSGAPLLPNLYELVYRWDSPNSSEILHIVPPTLSRLHITEIPDAVTGALNSNSRQEWEASFRMLLSTLFSKTPHLKSLALGARDFLPGSISSPIVKLSGLRDFTLCFNSADVNTLRVLAALPDLRAMRLDGINVASEMDPIPSSFPHLEVLRIAEHPTTNRFYEAFFPLRLTDLTISRYPGHLSFRHTCEAWARSCPSLQAIKCMVDDPEFIPRNWNAQPISHVIKPLFSISTMVSFTLEFAEGHFVVLDHDILEISAAWPSLKKLHLYYTCIDPSPQSYASGTQPVPQNPGVASLLCLAVQMPHLLTLTLTGLEIRGFPQSQIERLPVCDHSLAHLTVGRVKADDIASVAVIVDRLFPHLHIPPTGEGVFMEAEVKQLWHTVWACQMARRQQEQRGRTAAISFAQTARR